MNLSSIKVGVIGLGRMGIRHIEAINKMGMTICGVVDISPNVLAETSQKFDIDSSLCFEKVDLMLAKSKPDAIVIATTAPSHAEFTIMAAHHNVKYILCEKPMAVSISEAIAMIDACSHYGCQLAINHQMMFLEQYTEIKKIIDSNDFGSLSSILVAGSNFGLAMNASHIFEMFRYLTNAEIATIQAWFEKEKIPNPRGEQFEDYSGHLIAKNAIGTRLFIDFSAQAGHGLQVTYIFKYGQIIVDELSGYMRTTCRKEEFKHLPTTRYGEPANIKQIEIKPVELIDSTIMVWKSMISNSIYPDVNVGLHVIKCLIGAIESNENNHAEISIDKMSMDRSRKFKWA